MTTTVSYTVACPELQRRNSNGNTATKVDSNGTTTYSWDYIDRLASVTLPGTGGTVTFKYDPFGRRIQKVSTTGTTNYLYDGANSIEELDATGTVLARYSQGPGVDQPLSDVVGGAAKFYDPDGLGSITSLADISGTLTDTYTTDSFGKTTASSGTARNPYRYTARDFDPETGLFYYRARYYDPQVGRFISEDPIGFKGGINFYAYVFNNPLLFRDPTGRACLPGQFSRGDKALLIISCLFGLDPDYVTPMEGPKDSTDSPVPVNGQHGLPGPAKRPLNPNGGDSQTPDNTTGGVALGAQVADCISRVLQLPLCNSRPCQSSTPPLLPSHPPYVFPTPVPSHGPSGLTQPVSSHDPSPGVPIGPVSSH